jgi:hypothetical protein
VACAKKKKRSHGRVVMREGYCAKKRRGVAGKKRGKEERFLIG